MKPFNFAQSPEGEAGPQTEAAQGEMAQLHSAPPDSTLRLPPEAYAGNEEHLWDELRRIDQLIRAQTLRWRLTIGESKPSRLWGMIHVTDAEVESYLESPFVPPGGLPEELEREMESYWRAAEEMADSIRARLDQATSHDDLRLVRLQRLFDLSDFERDILLVCLLSELDSRYRRLFGYLQDDASRTRPTVELALQTLYPIAREIAVARSAFDAESPLIRRRLIVLNGDAHGDEPLPMRSLRCDDRIANYLLGDDAVDGRLAGVISPGYASLPACESSSIGHSSRPSTLEAMRTQEASWDDLMIEPERLARLKALSQWWREKRIQGGAQATIFLHGPYGSGRQKTALAFCATAQSQLLTANVESALRKGDWERTVDLCYREAMLRDAAVYWAGCETLLDREQPSQQTPHLWDYLVAAAGRFRGLTFFASRSSWDPAGHLRGSTFLRLDFPAPDFKLRQRIWEKHLSLQQDFAAAAPDRAALAKTLANAFQLSEGQVVDALASARGLARQRDPHTASLTVEDIYEGCRRQSSRRLIAFAKRIEPRTNLTFDNLILPPSNKRQLEELRTRISYQKRLLSETGFERRLSLGKGLIALFTGSSGTGKTMAAELLARDQGVDLYKVDLSAVISKYVGETEKNLSRVFDEAEDCNAMIFFDEADAIFGKRGKVEDARDRWANIEVNYLLQRVEEYSGTVILASNLRQNIDEGFLRRIHVIVEFPFPESQARFSIWRGMFPPEVNRPNDEELRSLAEIFRLPGGSIRNIVVDAASRALGEANGNAPAIKLRHLVLSTAREYQKLGKPITKGEFGVTFFDWIREEILMNAKE
jgi:SpoVK/Ycf46/Vps4 family AAA+-type ATPase